MITFGVGVGSGVGVGAGVAFGVGVGVGAGVAFGVGVGVGAGVAFGVGVGVGAGVAFGAGVGVGVALTAAWELVEPKNPIRIEAEMMQYRFLLMMVPFDSKIHPSGESANRTNRTSQKMLAIASLS